MSKSLEFCKTRASNPEISCWSNRNWDNAKELDVLPFINECLGDLRQYHLSGLYLDDEELQYDISFTIDPNGEFDYFTSDSFMSDGTLLFEGESIHKLINRVLWLRTYNKNYGIPVNGCNVCYTIGNIVILHEFDGDWVPEDKKWMDMRTTILLPLKCVYK